MKKCEKLFSDSENHLNEIQSCHQGALRVTLNAEVVSADSNVKVL